MNSWFFGVLEHCVTDRGKTLLRRHMPNPLSGKQRTNFKPFDGHRVWIDLVDAMLTSVKSRHKRQTLWTFISQSKYGVNVPSSVSAEHFIMSMCEKFRLLDDLCVDDKERLTDNHKLQFLKNPFVM